MSNSQNADINIMAPKQGPELQAVFERIKRANDDDAGEIFANEVLPM
jgi:hypothetical protein